MKRILTLVIFAFLFSTTLLAQEENIPLPEFINSFYAINNNNLLPLESQEGKLDIKTKSKFFSVSSSSSYRFNKLKSDVRFTSKTITLIYEPQESIDPSQSVRVVKLFTDDKTNSRLYNMMDMNISVLGSKTNTENDNQTIPFNYKKHKGKYIIIELNNLEQGEYGLYTISPMKMQLFGVDF